MANHKKGYGWVNHDEQGDRSTYAHGHQGVDGRGVRKGASTPPPMAGKTTEVPPHMATVV